MFLAGYISGFIVMFIIAVLVIRKIERPQIQTRYVCPHGNEWDDCPVCNH